MLNRMTNEILSQTVTHTGGRCGVHVVVDDCCDRMSLFSPLQIYRNADELYVIVIDRFNRMTCPAGVSIARISGSAVRIATISGMLLFERDISVIEREDGTAYGDYDTFTSELKAFFSRPVSIGEEVLGQNAGFRFIHPTFV